MAILLFGKPSSSLSPVELLSAAQALAELTGWSETAGREAIARQGANETPSTPAEADRYLRSEIVKWAGVVKKAGVHPE